MNQGVSYMLLCLEAVFFGKVYKKVAVTFPMNRCYSVHSQGMGLLREKVVTTGKREI